MQSCRNAPWKPPSHWTLSLSLHKQPQSLLIHKGRKGASEDCFEERPHNPETLQGRWEFLDKVSFSSCPETAHFFPLFILKGSFNPSSQQSKKAELQPGLLPWAHPGPADVSFAVDRTQQWSVALQYLRWESLLRKWCRMKVYSTQWTRWS